MSQPPQFPQFPPSDPTPPRGWPAEATVPQRSWVSRHKIATGLLAVFGLLFVAGVAGAILNPQPKQATTSSAATLAAPSAAVTEDAAEDTTEPATEDAAPETPASQPVPASVTYNGRGDKVLKIKKPDDGAVLLQAKYKGSANFVIQTADESQLLVNHVGSYTGTTVLDADGGDSDKIKVTASGSWTITLRSVFDAKSFTGSAAGKGDSVLMYNGKSGTAAFTYRGAGNFVVQGIGGSFPDLMVNEIGSYKGQDVIEEGPLLLQVTATGSWTIKVTED